MNGASLLVLGSGAIVMTADRSAAGYLVRSPLAEDAILMDPGPGSLRRLAEARVPPGTIGRVFITHFHPDHHMDLLALLFARRNPALSPVRPLLVVAPVGMRAILAAWESVYGRWIHDPALQVREIGPSDHFFEDLTLRARKTLHTDHSLCFRLEFPGGKTLAYSGDSDECPGLVEAARDADLFVCECSFPEDQYVAGHLTPQRAGRVAQEARARHLLLTHFYPPCDAIDVVAECRQTFAGKILKAEDLRTYAF
jgi:ribonuclease BN (tRNA processing enzyme)